MTVYLVRPNRFPFDWSMRIFQKRHWQHQNGKLRESELSDTRNQSNGHN